VNLGTGDQRVKQGTDPSQAVHGDGDAHHGLIDGVRCLVREDASGEAGDHLLHPRLVRRVQDVVVDMDVSPLGTERLVRSVGWGPSKPCTLWVGTPEIRGAVVWPREQSKPRPHVTARGGQGVAASTGALIPPIPRVLTQKSRL